MAQFASDDFTGSDGTELSAHNASWSLHTSYTGEAKLISNRLRQSTTDPACYYHSGTPASADYNVESDFFTKQAGGGLCYGGVVGRLSTSANTMYLARHNPVSGWQLLKAVAGTFNQLGASVATSLADETTYNIRLEMIGTAIKVYLNRNSTPIIAQTDGSITAAGKAGYRISSSGTPGDTVDIHFDNFTADDVETAVEETLTSATFDFAEQDIQNTVALTLSAATFDFTEQDVQNTAAMALSSATFDFVEQDVQNTAALTLSAAAFDFTAESITITVSSGASVDIDEAAFDFTPNNAQITVNSNLNADAFDFTPNDVQLTRTINLSAAAFDFVAQDLADHQVLLHLGAGTFNFVAKSIRAGDPLAGSGRATNLMLMGVGN